MYEPLSGKENIKTILRSAKLAWPDINYSPSGGLTIKMTLNQTVFYQLKVTFMGTRTIRFLPIFKYVTIPNSTKNSSPVKGRYNNDFHILRLRL